MVASGLRRRSSKAFVPRARYRELSDGPDDFGVRPVSRDGTGQIPSGRWTDEFPPADNLFQPSRRHGLPNSAFEMTEDEFGVLRKPIPRSAFISHTMETITENSAETESQASLDPDVLPSPKRPATLSAKSSRVSSARGRDPHSRESLRMSVDLSLGEPSTARAMNVYRYVSMTSEEFTSRTTPMRHQSSLLDIDSYKPLLSFANTAPHVDESPVPFNGTRQFMLEPQSELGSRRSQRSLQQTSEAPRQIDVRGLTSTTNGQLAAALSLHLRLGPEARMENDSEERDVLGTSDSSPRGSTRSSSARRKRENLSSPLLPGFTSLGVPSLTDSGVRADEEDNNMDCGDDMMSMMGTTPLLKAISRWHVEERYFSEDLTAFSCDPRTQRSVGYIPFEYRKYFQRLHNPLLAFGYEVQRYCMRYVGGYDLSLQIQLLQKSQQDRELSPLYRDSGIGSDVYQNCGCESGRSCRRQGSSRDLEPRSPTPPPRLSIPLIDDRDEDDSSAGLGITNDLFFPPQPPRTPKEPKQNIEKSDSVSSIRSLRKMGRLPTKETLREVMGSTNSARARGKRPEVYAPSPEQEASPTQEAPRGSKRRREVSDDLVRPPRLNIPDLSDPSSDDRGSGSGSGSGSTTRSGSRTSTTTSSVKGQTTTSSTASQRSAATLPGLTLPRLPKPVPLTPRQNDSITRAIYTTMEALILMRDFMSDLDDAHSILRLNPAECDADVRTEARRRVSQDLLPQTLDRINGTVAVVTEQARIVGNILDGAASSPIPTRTSSSPLNRQLSYRNYRNSPSQNSQQKQQVALRGTPAWARATALESTMTGGLPLPPSARPSASSTLLRPATTTSPSHRRLPSRPVSRICAACARIRFRAVQQLVHFRFLDSFTYWNLERLENRLDKLCLEDGHDGAGTLCAMRYTVQGLAQEIIARRKKQIGIADTEERMSVDTEEWERVRQGQEEWVSRVLGPRGRKNATAWVEQESESENKEEGEGKRSASSAGQEGEKGEGLHGVRCQRKGKKEGGGEVTEERKGVAR
ncbi:hypothetical protein QBC34DRAFT_464150 [Podospora aff. communis PSN243]|uniref:Uncharacterized protein n=1 Tax=Podospora aff. communis PSN243 TaxID=3040156 RepID=A0AAV9GL63_9PEZI|nr:hypothetical protein QBC34DRAFT_464150 [Podospora aff. communis PSN243]